MLKNISFLALAGALTFAATGCIVVTDDSSDTNGDGDGDATTGGDGDGDATTGDGDGDATTGDGDGDATGDGDGDATGDGDGDAAPSCGWVEDPDFPGYYCGGQGEDPNGTAIGCPEGLVEGDSCETTGITGAGCCDANGDNWYCGQDNQGTQIVVFESCAG